MDQLPTHIPQPVKLPSPVYFLMLPLLSSHYVHIMLVMITMRYPLLVMDTVDQLTQNRWGWKGM